jgi:hypothetical protein
MNVEFPTGKPHISYSEIKTWAECPKKHRLTYVDKIQTFVDNPYSDFGTIIHEEIEFFLENKTIDIERVYKKLDKVWEEKQYDSQEYIDKIKAERAMNGWKYTHETLSEWKNSANNILLEFPNFMDKEFPNWEPICAEFKLYEDISGSEIKFKGFIDCVIGVTNKNKKTFWILDWKTTGKGGWFYTKRKEFISLAQIGLYKTFWAKRLGVNLRDIKAGYVFLKRGAKPNKTCELLKVSVGPKFIEKTDKLIKRMIVAVKKGISLKNPDGCKFCPYRNTEHCDGNGW